MILKNQNSKKKKKQNRIKHLKIFSFIYKKIFHNATM